MGHLFMFLFTCIYGAAEGHNFVEGQMTMESYAEATSFPHTYDPKYNRDDWTFENTIYMLETPAYKPIFTKTLEECVEGCRSLSNCAAAAWNAPGELCFYWDYTRKIVESDADGEDCGTFTYIKVNWADSKCPRPTGALTTTDELLIEEETTHNMETTATTLREHETTSEVITTEKALTTEQTTTTAEATTTDSGLPTQFTYLVLCPLEVILITDPKWEIALKSEGRCDNHNNMNVCVALNEGNCDLTKYYIRNSRAIIGRAVNPESPPFYLAKNANECGATLILQKRSIPGEARDVYASGGTVEQGYEDMGLWVWEDHYCKDI